MRHRLRNIVWRELPFSARRAIVNGLRAVDDFERAVYNFWQNLRYSPAWLFVAATGTAGIVLTVMLFITLSRELLARAEGRAGSPRVDVAEFDHAQASRWDTRLCLENEGLAAIPYDAEFSFRGKLPPLAISRRVPEPEPEPVAAVISTEERPVERPRLDSLVELWRQPQQPIVRPEILTAVSEMAATAERTLTQADGWDRGHPHPKAEVNIPPAYTGDAELNLAAHEQEDDLWTDPTAFPNRSDVAFRVQLQTPRRVGIGERGQSEILIRNDGNETLRRVLVSEPIAPLPLVTDAHPSARLQEGLLEREFRRLRPGRERTLALDWFARDIGDRQHEAIILAEAVVAATVQVEAGQAEAPLETEPAPEEPLVSPPRERPRPVVEPVDALPMPRPPEPAKPEPAPVVDVKPMPKEEPVKVVVPPPRVRIPKPSIACKVKPVPATKVNDVVELKLEVTNNGETPLNDVRIWADVPESLKHRYGSQLELAVGSLEPGQVHHAVLRVVGQQAGAATATFRVVSAENIKANALGQVAVVAPKSVKTAPKPARPRMTTPTCPCECDASSVIWAGYEF